MKFIFICALLGALAAVSLAQTASIKPQDLKSIEGSWAGTLTYIDYSSNKPTAIQSQLKVAPASNASEWTFEYIYPLEPKANTVATMKLGPDGRFFDGEEIIGRTIGENGILSITTTKRGKDNGRDATFRRIFSIAADSFSIRKEVKVDGTDTYFERNTYRWTRQR